MFLWSDKLIIYELAFILKGYFTWIEVTSFPMVIVGDEYFVIIVESSLKVYRNYCK